jgi:hypothetical protein
MPKPTVHMSDRHGTPDRGGRVFWLIVALLTVAYCFPVALTDHLPIQDIPNHLAIVRTLAAEGSDPTWGEHFENRLGLNAYSTYYALCAALAKAMGAEAANRVVLAIYVVFFPLGFLCLVGAIDWARRWNVIPALLLIYSDLYLVGFTNYIIALPLFLLAAGFGLRIARSDTSRWPLVVGLGVLAALLYFTHPFALAMLVAVLAVFVWSVKATPRQILWVCVALLPCLALLFHRLPTSSIGAGIFYHRILAFKLRYLAETPFIALDAHGHWTFWAAALLGATFAGLALVDIVIGAREKRAPGGRAQWWRDGALLSFGLFLIAYLASPFQLGNATWFDLRLAVPAWLLLLLALKPQYTRGLLRKVLVVAMSIVSLLGVWSLHRSFDREIAPLFEVIDAMRPSAAVLPILVDPFSNACQPFYFREMNLPCYSPYTHFGSYYHVEKGGEDPFMTFHPSCGWIPLGLKNPLYGQAFHILDPFLPDRLLGELPRVVDHFDYVLVRGLDPESVQWIQRFALPVARAGPFAVFEVRQPSRGGRPR